MKCDFCSTWVNNQGDKLLNLKINDVYRQYALYCKDNNIPYVLRGTFKHIVNNSNKWKLYYNKFVFTNEWEGRHA